MKHIIGEECMSRLINNEIITKIKVLLYRINDLLT